MQTGTVALQLPGTRTADHAWSRRIGLVVLFGFVAWSVSGKVEAEVPGTATCTPHGAASAMEYLTGDACPPESFADTMGYEPVLVHTPYGWRYAKPGWAGGFCSPPLTDHGPFWDFETACRTHDYGYDLVRFGAGDRATSDRLLYRDMMSTCRTANVLEEAACTAMARWARTVLRVGDATGFDPEPLRPAA